jgi:hypothetical protein
MHTKDLCTLTDLAQHPADPPGPNLAHCPPCALRPV